MSTPVLTFEEIKHNSVEELVKLVLKQQAPIIIRVSEDQVVTVQQEISLKPLRTLEGSLPEGWREAIYE